jgi:(4-(4-[2-(gamma-L-glutamylamino)ethyl]phenoxymethyl)furan-2-yl)methanamine synthase
MTVLGLDIGGANIKAANQEGNAVSKPFPIWRDPHQLQSVVASILQQFPETTRIALTMTAELADCFATKADGVWFILDAVESAAKNFKASVIVWTIDGRFVPSQVARDLVSRVAAANWHALATWCGTFVPHGSALLIDIGSTTTDIIRLVDGQPRPTGFTDLGRLQSGELSYSGVWRTPLCAVAHSVPFRDGYCSVAAELFATTVDVYLLLGRIPEDPQNFDTANGKPVTKSAAYDRIARMLCCDRDELSYQEAVLMAKFLADVQRQRLAGALDRVVVQLPGPCASVVIAGSGSFLARQIAEENRSVSTAKQVSLSDQLSPEIATAACAYAVARLATA